MLINDVISKVYPIKEAASGSAAIKRLGAELDRIYNSGGSWKIEGIDPTMGEVAELYDVYKNIVHDHVDPNKITTISKNVSDILKALGFNVVEKGIGWSLKEESLEESRRYTFMDLPDWAKPIVKDEFGERQTYSDLYVDSDFVEIAYSEGGDYMRFRIRKDGTVTAR